MFDLSGKTALVTGATSGIGEAVARALIEHGTLVAGAGRRGARLDELHAELGSGFVPLQCDLSDRKAVTALPSRAADAVGDVAILVNNAGLTRDNLLLRLSDSDWDEVLAVNLTAAMLLSKGVMRGMMRARWGRIINVTSVVAATGNPGQVNYAASKAGLTALTKSMAVEVASRNITVNAVAPGMIGTAMTNELPETRKSAIAEQIPTGRMGTVDEVAAAIVFLASTEAGYVTGTTLHVNGGLAMI
ncbi:MAG: 3-oxoacyl-ACP reductase FabG [Rhodobacteraceae bacterium]|nr:3-oxoacyl-ACP reductase FabG [Paracoccaceae bacterium]